MASAKRQQNVGSDIGSVTVRQLKVADLQEASYNPRVISDEALGALRVSLKRYGLVEPVVVNVRGGKNVIVGGHQRVRVLADAGIEKCACVIVDLNKKQEKLLNVTLNNPRAQGEFVPHIDDYIDRLKNEIGNDELMLDLQITKLIEETPAFEPTEESPPRLDELAPKVVTCPACKMEFDARDQL